MRPSPQGAAVRPSPAAEGAGLDAGAATSSSASLASNPRPQPTAKMFPLEYRSWQQDWEDMLQAARDELCVGKGFIIFLSAASLSTVLLFVFDLCLTTIDALSVAQLVSRGAARHWR